jgi:hypothetical protein
MFIVIEGVVGLVTTIQEDVEKPLITPPASASWNCLIHGGGP